MRRIGMFIILGTLIILSACGKNSSNVVKGDVDIHGYVLDKTDSAIFVVSKSNGTDDYYDAINLSNAPTDVRIGDEVKVWYEGGVQESYPMGGKVGHLEIMPEIKPEGANLTQRDALQKSLEDAQEVIVKSISFDLESSLWIVEFKALHEEGTWHVEVSDSK